MKLNSYLNFDGDCEEAFNFYKNVFKTEFSTEGFSRFGDMPATENTPEMSQELKNRVMNVMLPVGEDTLYGSDVFPGFGKKFLKGNNIAITISPDTREEADRIFEELSAGGEIEMPMQDQFWGDYFGSFTDKFGIGWMINFTEKSTF